MIQNFIHELPDDIINIIWEKIEDKYKPFLSRTLYSKHHTLYIQHKYKCIGSLHFQAYILFIMKNNISIALLDLLKNLLDMDIISSYKKLHFSHKIFFSYYELLKYIGKKHKSYKCVELLKMCDNRSITDRKLHKNFIRTNISWTI